MYPYTARLHILAIGSRTGYVTASYVYNICGLMTRNRWHVNLSSVMCSSPAYMYLVIVSPLIQEKREAACIGSHKLLKKRALHYSVLRQMHAFLCYLSRWVEVTHSCSARQAVTRVMKLQLFATPLAPAGQGNQPSDKRPDPQSGSDSAETRQGQAGLPLIGLPHHPCMLQ